MPRIPLKTLTFTYLCLLVGFGLFVRSDGLLLGKVALLFTLQTLLELAILRYNRKPFAIPRSGLISAGIMALVINPLSSWWVYSIAPLLVVGAKRYIRLGKVRHIANPAGFALVALSLFNNNLVSWWGVANMTLLIPILIYGLYTAYRVKGWIIVAAYTLVYATGILVLNAPLKSSVLDPTFIFFATIMLIEPVTSSFPRRIHQIFYGVLCAVIGIKLIVLYQLPILERLDPLLSALVLGGMISGFLFAPKRPTLNVQEGDAKSGN